MYSRYLLPSSLEAVLIPAANRLGNPPDAILVYSALPVLLWAKEQHQLVVRCAEPSSFGTSSACWHCGAWLSTGSWSICFLLFSHGKWASAALSSVVITAALDYCCIWQTRVSAAPSVHEAERERGLSANCPEARGPIQHFLFSFPFWISSHLPPSWWNTHQTITYLEVVAHGHLQYSRPLWI